MKKGPENPVVQKLVVFLEKAGKKNNARIWSRVAYLLKMPARKKPCVNLFKVNKYCKEGEQVIIPGKLLSLGKLSHKLVIAALSSSASAAKKVGEGGGKLVSIKELVEENPGGKGVKIIV